MFLKIEDFQILYFYGQKYQLGHWTQLRSDQKNELKNRAQKIFNDFGWEKYLDESIWFWNSDCFIAIRDQFIKTDYSDNFNNLEMLLIGTELEKQGENIGTETFQALK